MEFILQPGRVRRRRALERGSRPLGGTGHHCRNCRRCGRARNAARPRHGAWPQAQIVGEAASRPQAVGRPGVRRARSRAVSSARSALGRDRGRRRPGAAARSARRRSVARQRRHRLGADAPRDRRGRRGSAIGQSCWSATRHTIRASASRPTRPAGSPCPDPTSGTACWRWNWSKARLHGACGVLRPAGRSLNRDAAPAGRGVAERLRRQSGDVS